MNFFMASSRTSENNYFNIISLSYVNLGETDLAGVNGKNDPYILDPRSPKLKIKVSSFSVFLGWSILEKICL